MCCYDDWPSVMESFDIHEYAVYCKILRKVFSLGQHCVWTNVQLQSTNSVTVFSQ